MRVSIIGSGNVATWFAYIFNKQGFQINQVYSLHIENAQTLANKYKTKAIDKIAAITADADLYLIALKDDCLSEILTQLTFKMPLAVITAGSLSQHILKPYAEHYGVIYPYQSISKVLDFNNLIVPLCIEGDNKETEQKLYHWAEKLSSKTYFITEKQRATLHLAAVFASNFSNAMYGIGYDLLQKANIDWSIILPLLTNTLDKVNILSPTEAQTGPARRGDQQIMQQHIDSLKDENLKKIYHLISSYITERQ
ncbi:MAG: DUF2520 domain-containing protein [Bacteroidales bacterium]|nr:DUF2520 domain-containing protein [Bacteroidales bacterium]